MSATASIRGSDLSARADGVLVRGLRNGLVASVAMAMVMMHDRRPALRALALTALSSTLPAGAVPSAGPPRALGAGASREM